ncbi:GNAT family N-acetyltransferase [uncultured Flavobacterium sp.]|uniref:GNAT family N-acetyltransferase n=1 Tax=uncultured Flavobacterium sp. TaxID=165435 RepID=UPI0030C7DE8A
MQILELTTKETMLEQLPIIQHLYADFTLEKYESLLDEMLPINYKQVIIQENNETIGLAGFWIATKLWCGKYLELDNVIVHPSHRSKGIGKVITEYLVQKAIDNNCTMAALDAYTTNFAAQKFYMNLGFVPKGFHFVKDLK